MTFVGLAERLDKSRSEAKEILDFYYKTFPALQKFFNEAEEFSVNNNYIRGIAPTKRVRFFHPPTNEGERQAIAREGKNLQIQEANASMLKIAIIKLRKYILDNNYPAKLHLPVHDEILSSCPKEKGEEWLQIQNRAMCEAADLFIEPGLLKVDSKILTKWAK
jgi:DNA polymerase-1